MKTQLPAVLALGALLGGCAIVPGTGPTVDQIVAGTDSRPIEQRAPTGLLYALVSANVAVADALAAIAPLPGAFIVDEPPPTSVMTIRPGDEIAVTIVNVSQAGFIDFAQASVSPLATTLLPPQIVAADGRISVPPLGRIAAAGRTPQSLEQSLKAQLAEVLIEPSVIVRLVDRLSGQVAVMGEVSNPGSFPLLTDQMRLLDLIGAAGGPRELANRMDLLVVRDGRSTRTRFDRFLSRPDWNVRAWPGDVLKLEPSTRRYTLLGAANVNGEFGFEDESFSLAQALGRGRGLAFTQASRTGVFVYRPTPKSVLERLSVRPVPFDVNIVPTVYHFDMSSPATLFAAQRFQIEDGDLIYIPDAPLTELSKVLSAFNLGVGSARNVFLITD